MRPFTAKTVKGHNKTSYIAAVSFIRTITVGSGLSPDQHTHRWMWSRAIPPVGTCTPP